MKGTFRSKRRDIIAKTFIWNYIGDDQNHNKHDDVSVWRIFHARFAHVLTNTASQFFHLPIFKRNRAHLYDTDTYLCVFPAWIRVWISWLPWWNVFCYFLIKEFMYMHVLRRRNVKNEFHFILLSLWECGTGCHYRFCGIGTQIMNAFFEFTLKAKLLGL